MILKNYCLNKHFVLKMKLRYIAKSSFITNIVIWGKCANIECIVRIKRAPIHSELLNLFCLL